MNRSDASRVGTSTPVTGKIPVVYLAGSGHTGSTLLAMLADVHPSVASVGEIAIKPKIRQRGDEAVQNCSCGARVLECPFWQAVFSRVRQQSGPGAEWAHDYRFANRLAHRIMTRDTSQPLIQGFRRWAERSLPVYRDRTRRIDAANVAFVRAVLAESGASVFFDTTKGPARLAHLLSIDEFDLRVVTLVRDVRAYAASARRRGKSATDAAETWRKDQLTIRSLTTRLPEDHRMLIRYEDLCEDPARTLTQLWAFSGVDPIEPPARVFSRDHHVLGNNMRMAGPIEIRLDERWRREMGQAEVQAILQIAGPLHHEFGYSA